MIYVTLGTMFMDFARLIKKMDAIARDTGEEVVMQTGMAKTRPRHCSCFDFKPHEELLALQAGARLVVAHAGIGVTLDALRLRKPLVLVPRRRCFGEHMNDHQVEIAEAVERRGWGRMVLDVEELDRLCAEPPAAVQDYAPDSAQLVAYVKSYVDSLSAELA
jgi:beta-1,4-N-acetylglucosaminyltransferase